MTMRDLQHRSRPATAAIMAAAALVLNAAGVTAQDAAPAGEADGVDSVFGEWNHEDTPGCAVGVYRDGAVVLARGYGMADLERRVPITPHTVFDIGSTSKQFAAASILLLEQQGRLSLDDNVRTHVPELPEYARSITIRHLLHHTSGLRDYIGLLTFAGSDIDDVTTADEALAMIARQRRLNFEPGDEHLYSNSGYFLLSIIVERVAGKSLRDFAREQIFAPLGMQRTHYLGSYDDIVPDRALAYSPRGDGLRTDMSRWLQLGDGAVFTTVEDLLLWDRNFYDGAVGGEDLVAALQVTGTLNSGEAIAYARGLTTGEYRGVRTVSHGGAWGGYRAELMRFPEQRFSVAVLCNLASTNPTRLARQVADIYLGDVLAPPPPSQPAREDPAAVAEVPVQALLGLAGAYRDPVARLVRTIVFDDGALHLATAGPRYPLLARSEREFRVGGVPADIALTFDPGDDLRPATMVWSVDGGRRVTLERVEVVQPDADDLAEYAGSYYSDELQATFTIEAAGSGLVLRRPGAQPQRLGPSIRDEFTAGGLIARFRRAAGGGVDGLLLDLGRIRDLEFSRTNTP
ncbi:MAG TPA: serine hydrolase domain-containing protein [Longimicrobiales bacterium]|nr:serine hydrolase domain-containing protein [Longimicrobiales bacterium]